MRPGTLSKSISSSYRTRVLAATGHALAFTTWRSLVRDQGLDDARATDLMCRLVAAASSSANNR